MDDGAFARLMRPFEPFEVRLTNGDVHQVRHPEFAILLRSNLIIGYADSDRFAICSLLHIASVQTIHPAVP